MTVKELKEQLKGMPDGWPVFVNTEHDAHPDFDRLCFYVYQDLDADAIILKGCE